MRKMFSMYLLVFLLLALAACSGKPYGHYKDDEMIGKIGMVDIDNSVIEVDISEWHKRDIRGGIDDYGVYIKIDVTDHLIIKNEDGTLSEIHQLKIGQKVLVNPPKKVDNSDYEAKEIILQAMSYKEKYAQLLSGHKGRYLTTVFVKEGDSLPAATEDTLMGLLSKSPINFGTYPEDYVVDYKQELNIEKFPVMLVFDNKGLVFKTYDVDELVDFF
ncbi:hypothetical protein PAT3040_02880 [Paenibacillus agaridevorans]|uniref:DUF3221 domain-containing protein n=1 Tax=Paenibacillus agaridevorans TaxID=171404 RepID=A0A2R5EY54_9BACL|nr:hypothetical protein [Paenibacillus agaridevorans]GBG08301.1 hypothetical protein PAT3040_02880 [Paenibacillus agaridevorans]